MHWRVAGASDAHAMSVMASALELREGRSRRVELSLSLSHTHTHKSGQREGICALSLISLGSGRRSVNERRERRRVVLHGWVAAALSKSYRARVCCGDLKPDYETPMQRRRRCAAAPGGERRERYLRDACRAGGSRQGAGCVGSCSGPREYSIYECK